ncbi:MAG: DEAD/DEAH box helicase [Planctomycetota bacterium]|nr:DEAD/DEAH box helicase [Planctomycetota bacterium]
MPLDAFHPAVRRWFETNLGEPTRPQREGWPAIRAGQHTLIAAPTGSGKTLAAFLHALDALLRQGPNLPDATQALYVSPLKALSNDIQKNLEKPLAEIAAEDLFLPEVRVLVRTGDTQAKERAAMTRRPPHILVTTPESLYILLTTEKGRRMLSTVRTVIVDEIHALARDKRGSHLALSLERLEALAGPVQRVGLSATQKPLDEIAKFLVGAQRECTVVDGGHLRELDIAVEVPPSPLQTVCSHEQWDEIHARLVELINAHRTTLLFVGTRKLAERLAARLSGLLGKDRVTCHHGSLSRAHRLDAEQRLKAGKLRALVATASLELGIDIGEVDLAIQIGSPRSIATFLQRVGRAGHGVGRVPKGRLFPLTTDELVEAAALLRAVGRGELDRIPQPERPLDILAQQLVAACVPETWDEDDLFQVARRAWPYRELSAEDFDRVLKMHAAGRRALLHRDGVNRRVRATKRARLAALLNGGAIPDQADYRVLQEPGEVFVGTINEDFAVESNGGDIFQLGNASWRVLKVESRAGVMRVADAQGAPPTIPFWIGEAPSRTAELSEEVGRLREEARDEAQLQAECRLPHAAARQVLDYLAEGKRVLGATPTQKRVVAERFFDESGGQQLVIHAPFGGRVMRAWGLALRKRFCRGFGFELQAAANEEALLLSLAPTNSFALETVFDFLHPNSARQVLEQAVLTGGQFETRWRWNVQRALLVERSQAGKRVPAPLLRMRSDDELQRAFPQVAACPENLPPGPLEVPSDHPLVAQTLADCLTELLDAEGLVRVLEGLRDGTIERVAVDTPEPSAFARGILNAMPYSFLDDAPLEERRTQAVVQRRALNPRAADEIGQLDPDAVARVKDEAWPHPEHAEEVHEALLWMGYVTEAEARAYGWSAWLDELAAAGRVRREGERFFAAEAAREPKDLLRGRMEALGPVFDPPKEELADFLALENEGAVLRVRMEGRAGWCERRLLARIHRYTLERLRREIEPVSAAEFLRFLGVWQHADDGAQLEGPAGVAEVIRQLAGFEVPAAAWERFVLRQRVRNYSREWLDQLTLGGQVVWGRLWGEGTGPIKTAPVCLLPREDLPKWLGLAKPPEGGAEGLGSYARAILDPIRARGALFPQELSAAAELLPEHFEGGLGELIGKGLVTCDSFGGLRALIVPPSQRVHGVAGSGRWSLFRGLESPLPSREGAGGGLGAAAGGRTAGRPARPLSRCRGPVRARSRIHRAAPAAALGRGLQARAGAREAAAAVVGTAARLPTHGTARGGPRRALRRALRRRAVRAAGGRHRPAQAPPRRPARAAYRQRRRSAEPARHPDAGRAGEPAGAADGAGRVRTAVNSKQ